MRTSFSVSLVKTATATAALAALLCTSTAQAQSSQPQAQAAAQPSSKAGKARAAKRSTKSSKKSSAKKPVAKPQAAATVPAQAQQAVGDYVVALVNSAPVTNYEVNLQARELAQQLAKNKAPVPAREALLNQALREVILQKAAVQSVRDTTLSLSEEEFANAEKQLAAERQLSVPEFRRQVMTERRIGETQYRKELSDQLLLSKMREARIGMAANQVTELEAIQWLRTQKANDLRTTENHARHILLPAADEAAARQAIAQLADVRKRIAAGKLDFAAAARELSKDSSAAQGGDLGWAPEGAFVPEFQEQVNALQPGGLSQAFVSRFGVHLVQLLDRRSAAMTQEQQIQAARNILRQQKAEEALRKWESEVRAQAYVEMREAPR
ncbi:MAG: peptidylprolyl isomerase [Brachymonas sp.]|nr:peptidylprolyl isomerase [Brachymonas sp.]